MEVAGPDYQLVVTRRTDQGLVQLVFEERTRSYYYQVLKKGVRSIFEYAGTDENEALAGFPNFLKEANDH